MGLGAWGWRPASPNTYDPSPVSHGSGGRALAGQRANPGAQERGHLGFSRGLGRARQAQQGWLIRLQADRLVSLLSENRQIGLAYFLNASPNPGESFADPRFHGCAFVNASAEAPSDSPIQQAAAAYRGWIRGVFKDLARQAGAPEPKRLARQFVMLYDGAAISARMDRGSEAAACARVAASALLDAALAAGVSAEM